VGNYPEIATFERFWMETRAGRAVDEAVGYVWGSAVCAHECGIDAHDRVSEAVLRGLWERFCTVRPMWIPLAARPA